MQKISTSQQTSKQSPKFQRKGWLMMVLALGCMTLLKSDTPQIKNPPKN